MNIIWAEFELTLLDLGDFNLRICSDTASAEMISIVQANRYRRQL
jgi:hypothetical protein